MANQKAIFEQIREEDLYEKNQIKTQHDNFETEYHQQPVDHNRAKRKADELAALKEAVISFCASTSGPDYERATERVLCPVIPHGDHDQGDKAAPWYEGFE